MHLERQFGQRLSLSEITLLFDLISKGKGKADDLYRGSMQSEDHRRTALQYPLFIGPYAAANNTALLAWRPSQGTKLYCLVNRGTFGVNNLPE